mgnify:CR=1 FL=1
MTVRVPLVEQRDASYDILIGRGLVREVEQILAKYCHASAYAIISDSHVGKLYGESLARQVSGVGCQEIGRASCRERV